MSLDKDSPSWLIYKSYFIKHSRGEQPRHLYDGYQDDHFTIQGSGPFSSKRALENDTATISYADDEDDISQPSVVEKFPKGVVKMIAPKQANLDKAKSSLRQEQARRLTPGPLTLRRRARSFSQGTSPCASGRARGRAGPVGWPPLALAR